MLHLLQLIVVAAILSIVLLPAAPAAAQSLEAQNNATIEIDKELDVPGDLSASSGGSVSFQSGSALTLSGSSSQQDINAAFSVPDLTLDNSNGGVLNAAVDVSGTLTLTSGALTTNGNLTLTSTGESASAHIAGSGSGSVSGDVTFERFLDKGDDASHFRMLSAPTATLLDDEGSGSNASNLLSNMWTQSDGTDTGADAEGASVDPSVFTYSEGTDLGGDPLSDAWTGVTNLNSGTGDFNPGTGFLAFLFADRDPDDNTTEGFPATLTATGPVQAEENNGNAVDLSGRITYTDNDSQSEDGWNLIANPFMAPIDWESIENDGAGLTGVDATIYVWDPENNGYAEYVADGSGTNGSADGTGTQDRYIAPFQAFFVKANGNDSDPDIGGIDSGDKDTGQSPEFKSNEAHTPQIALRLRAEGDTTGETTGFRYTEGASIGKDAYDAYQLEPLSTTRTLAASEMDGTDALFDHQNRPVPAEADTVDLALDITEGDTYALEASALQNLPPGWQVILENTESGARWDLGAGESASFEVEGTQSKSTSEETSPAALLQDGPTVATATEDGTLPSYRLFVGPSAALPVELAGFDATTDGSEVQLSWQTASETNNAGFAVERKAEGGPWTQVGYREGAGTTSEARTYRFTDTEVPFEADRLEYRLRQEDLDGTATLSKEITAELSGPSRARLRAPFPNPAKAQVTLRYEVPERLEGRAVRLAVYDVLGRRLRALASGPAEAGRHERRVDLGGLSTGTYFVRMRAGDRVQTRKITIVR